MKKYLTVLLMFLGVGAFALHWGALTDFVETSRQYREGKINFPYLITYVVADKPIRVWLGEVSAGGEGQLEPLRAEKVESARQLITELYNNWFFNTAKAIRKDGREQEFEDILPLIDKGVNVQITGDDEGANIRAVFTGNMSILRDVCGPSVLGCYVRAQEPHESPALVVSDKVLSPSLAKQEGERILMHEIGHSLGLADQYKPLDGNIGRNNSDIVYSTPEAQKSVMRSLFDHFRCDDVDGIINLIDLERGEFHGGKKGWKSFCKKPGYQYIEAIAVGKGPYFIDLDKESNIPGARKLTQWYGGEKIERSFAPASKGHFSLFEPLPPVTVLEQDGQGRPLRAKTADGVEIFYMYAYDRVWSLAVRGDEYLANDEYQYTYHKNSLLGAQKKQLQIHMSIFVDHDTSYVVFVDKTPRTTTAQVSVGSDKEGNPIYTAQIILNSAGEVIDDTELYNPKEDVSNAFIRHALAKRANLTAQERQAQQQEEKKRQEMWESLRAKVVAFALQQ